MYKFLIVILPALPQDFECVVDMSTAQCTWSQPAADSITNFFLSWRYDGPCSPDTQSFLLESEVRSYSLGGLEEGGDYTIRLYAINSVGAGPTASVQVSTPANGMLVHMHTQYVHVHSVQSDAFFICDA